MRAQFINENMGYTDFFGEKITHEDALQKSIRDHLSMIITEERGISEKDFSNYDSVIAEVISVCRENPEIYDKAQEFYDNNKRINLLAEEMYEKYFKNKKDLI